MALKSKIEWTENTWNPITGCTKISEGCRNCYACKMAEHFLTKIKLSLSAKEKLGAENELLKQRNSP